MIQETHHIKYLQQKDIDKKKWDACIDRAANGLIYGYSFYLDRMAANWDALILGDYEAVMPLTWKKKYGIHYLYQPFLTAQLGVFGTNLKEDLTDRFLDEVPQKFKYWDISLNHACTTSTYKSCAYERMNFILPLHNSYESIYKSYRENIKRNIKKATQLGCTPTTEVKIEEIIELTKLQMKEWNENDFENFIQLYKYIEQNERAKTYGIRDAQNNLLASCLFFFSHKRAYYILVGNHPNGRTLGASHALIDAFIKDHAEQDLILDFEGSDIRNLAFFYSSFGAMEEPYTALRNNKLSWWMRWIKK